MNKKFNVDIELITSNKLSFEAYFILWCLNYKDKVSLLSYTRNCKKISTETFNQLEANNYITINRQIIQDNQITFNSLTITNLGKDLFITTDFDSLFKELRDSYPKTAGRSGRKLHQDLGRCKTLYKKIINEDIELHKLICKAAKLYHNDKIKTNSEDYLQMLSTWLSQQNYELYLEDAKSIDYNSIEPQTNITSI